MKLRLQFVTGSALLMCAAIPCCAADGPGDSGSIGWTWPAYIAIPLLASAVLYAIGILKMCARGAHVPLIPAFCFGVGWLSLLGALDSPIHEISEQLFWVHMSQHEILMLISAPLLVLARPLVPFLWALPRRWRERIADIGKAVTFKRAWLMISAPVAAWLLHALALWLWHAPVLFVDSLQSDAVHALQHISFLDTALLFWWALLNNHGGRLGYGGAVLYVFTTAIHTSVLGAWLTFAPTAWYAPYTLTARAWHLTALQDQQLGGLIMWIPAGTLLTIVALILLIKWLQESQRRWEYTRTAAFIRMQGVAHEN